MKLTFRKKCTSRIFGKLRKLMQLKQRIAEEHRRAILEARITDLASEYLREPGLNLYGRQAYRQLRENFKTQN